MAEQLTVVDTSAWIEWLIESPLARKLRSHWPTRSNCVVPSIVQLELSKWLVRERGEDDANRVLAYTQKCIVVPLDTNLALLAAEMHRQYKLATADAIVFASAQDRGARLLTCDVHFANLPDVWLMAR